MNLTLDPQTHEENMIQKQLVYVKNENVHWVVPTKNTYSDIIAIELQAVGINADSVPDGLHRLIVEMELVPETEYPGGPTYHYWDIMVQHFSKATLTDRFVYFYYLTLWHLKNKIFFIRSLFDSYWGVTEEHPFLGHYLIQNTSLKKAVIFFIQTKFLGMHKDLKWFVPGKEVKIKLTKR